MHFRSWLFLFVVILSTLALVAREYRVLPDGKLRIHTLDVEQGDSILIVSPSGKQVLIDGGPDLSALERIGEYMPFFDRTIELLVLTHPDADHLAAFPDVLSRYKVERVLMSGIQHKSSLYSEFLDLLQKQNIPVILADSSQNIMIGDGLIFEVLWPSSQDVFANIQDPNGTSVVLMAHYGSDRILLTGDIEKEQEAIILASGIDMRADVIKVPHHGSRTSSSTGWLVAVHPKMALVSVGEENTFGHPHPDVMERYAQLDIPVRSTVEEGTISLEFTGKRAVSAQHYAYEGSSFTRRPIQTLLATYGKKSFSYLW